MKTIKNVFAIAALSAFAVACGGGAEHEAVEATDAVEVEAASADATYAVNEGSTLHWHGFKTNVPWGHEGTVAVTAGELTTQGDALVGGSFLMDMTSIVATDMEQGTEDYANLIGHLASPDFFAVDSFPQASFEITSLEALEDTLGNTHTISGNLTLRGESKNISFPAKVMMHDDMVHIKADVFTIDRTDWGVNFNSEDWLGGITEATKDKLIDHNIEIDFEIMASKS